MYMYTYTNDISMYLHMEQDPIFRGSSFGQAVIAMSIGAHLSSIKTPLISEKKQWNTNHFRRSSCILFNLKKKHPLEGPFQRKTLDCVVENIQRCSLMTIFFQLKSNKKVGKKI